MYEQMYFCWAQYAPYHILYCIEEMDWHCCECGKTIRIYGALMDVDHGKMHCQKCEIRLQPLIDAEFDRLFKSINLEVV
jgi:hypothetical protein